GSKSFSASGCSTPIRCTLFGCCARAASGHAAAAMLKRGMNSRRLTCSNLRPTMRHYAKILMVPIIMTLCMAVPAGGAEITLSPKPLGGTIVHISGQIFLGDETRFAAKTASLTDRTNTLVWLTSPGGNLVAALLIAKMVRDRGYSTMINQLGGCASA